MQEHGKCQELITQSILAMFYADSNEASLRSHQWPSVIKDLFEKIFKHSAKSMPEDFVKEIRSFNFFLIRDKATSNQLLFQNEIVC